MNAVREKQFTKAYSIICLLVFIVVCLRAFFIPISHDEASTFFFYIQSDNYLPYKAHVYTNNHVLNSALANICYHLAGSHRFVLRIPNVLSFLVLCFGVFRFFKHLNSLSSRIVLTCFFILTFNFLDFFELCRGYGLSLAFMVAGLAYLQEYFTGKTFRHLLLFSLCWQLALAANLTLVVPLTMLLPLIYVFQARHKLLFSAKNLALQVINLVILGFWIKFSFFYKSKGVLDSGIGDSYWEVTFKSLMLFIFGTDYGWMQALVLALFFIMLLVSLIWFFRKPVLFNALFQPKFFYLLFLTGLIVAFFLQKKLLDVNYPEDRTGLFFYVFFALSLTFFVDAAGPLVSALAAGPLLPASLVYFVLSFNLSSFTHYFYHVMPKNIYTYLEQEFYKEGKVFTIGGHINREMNYAFTNYRGGSMLNPMNDSPQMIMNCDYYYALKEEKPYYQAFYDEVAYDDRWDRVLLKRRQKIERREVTSLEVPYRDFSGNGEFYEFIRFTDSALTTRNCIEADLGIRFKNVPRPFKAFIVLQVNDENDNTVYYKRILLNWIADDLSGATKRFKLVSGPLPAKFKSIVVYLWNIDKKEAAFSLQDLKIFDLNAPGINVTVPADYYPYIEKMTKKHLL